MARKKSEDGTETEIVDDTFVPEPDLPEPTVEAEAVPDGPTPHWNPPTRGPLDAVVTMPKPAPVHYNGPPPVIQKPKNEAPEVA